MTRKINAGSLVAAVSLLAAAAETASPGYVEAGRAEELIEHGKRVLRDIDRKQLSQTLSEFHFPPAYSPEKVASDRAGMGNALLIIREYFGSILSAEPEPEPVELFNVGVSSGTIEYWKSLPNGGLSGGITFRIRSENVPEGIAQITYTTISDGRIEIRSIEFGIPANEASSRDRIDELQKELLDSFQRPPAGDGVEGSNKPQDTSRGE